MIAETAPGLSAEIAAGRSALTCSGVISARTATGSFADSAPVSDATSSGRHFAACTGVTDAAALVTGTTDDGLDITHWDDAGEHTDHLTARQAVTHARHGYAMTTHKLQGQTVDSLVIDFGPERDLSSTYVALTRHRNDVLTVVNIADIAEGPELEHLLATSSDTRRDAVIAKAAAAIATRGFDTSTLAHDITLTQLPTVPTRIATTLDSM